MKKPRRAGLLSLSSFDVLALANSGGLAAQFAQVVELGAANVSAGYDFNVLKDGRVDREDPLDADAVGNLADRERLANAAVLTADDDALENLDSLLIALDDLDMHFDRITDLERGDIFPHLFKFQKIDGVHWLILLVCLSLYMDGCFYGVPLSRSSRMAAAERTER